MRNYLSKKDIYDVTNYHQHSVVHTVKVCETGSWNQTNNVLNPQYDQENYGEIRKRLLLPGKYLSQIPYVVGVLLIQIVYYFYFESIQSYFYILLANISC